MNVRPNHSSKLFLFRKLNSLMLNEDGNISEYINEIYEIEDKLTTVDETGNDRDL